MTIAIYRVSPFIWTDRMTVRGQFGFGQSNMLLTASLKRVKRIRHAQNESAIRCLEPGPTVRTLLYIGEGYYGVPRNRSALQQRIHIKCFNFPQRPFYLLLYLVIGQPIDYLRGLPFHHFSDLFPCLVILSVTGHSRTALSL